MHAHEFRQLLGVIDTLGAEQRAQLTLHLAAGDGARAVFAIVEGRLETHPSCPRCADRQDFALEVRSGLACAGTMDLREGVVEARGDFSLFDTGVITDSLNTARLPISSRRACSPSSSRSTDESRRVGSAVIVVEGREK